MTFQRIFFVITAWVLVASGVFASEYPWWVQRNTPVALLYGRTAMAMVRVNWTGQNGKDEFQIDQLGVIVNDTGLILTPGYIRRSAFVTTSITVHFNATDSAKAEYIGKDTDLDIAFIRATLPGNPNIKPLDMSRMEVLSPGDKALLFTLLGTGFRFQPAVEWTHVVAISDSPLPHYVLDKPVASFTSFAPLFSVRGGFIGFAIPGTGTGILSRSGGNDLSLVIPAQLILPLITHPPVEQVERERQQGWLGIVMQPMSEELADYWKLKHRGGIIISQVLDNSPAAKAALQTGDIIVGFHGESVQVNTEEDIASFTRMVKDAPVGTPLPIEIYRDKTLTSMTITLGPRPVDQMFQKRYANALFGVTAKELDVSERVVLGLPETVRGVLALQVTEGSWCSLAELTPGDIITRIDNQQIDTLDMFEKTLEVAAEKRPARLLLMVRRGARTEFIAIKPQWDLVPAKEK